MAPFYPSIYLEKNGSFSFHLLKFVTFKIKHQHMDSDLENYVLEITQKESSLLQELNRETHQKILKPRMISGHLQGRLLSLLSKLIKPENILEIGTFTGYSALCLAEGLSKTGTLHTIDRNEELYDIQKKYFARSPYASQIIQYTGNAVDLISEIDQKFDLVFIDADKKNYPVYFDLIMPKLKRGGVLLSDNVLWYGKVLKSTSKGDADTAALKAFNQKLARDPRLENILLPLRDGLLISRKK